MNSQTNTITPAYASTMLEHMPVGVALFDAQDFRLLAVNALFNTFLDTFLDSSWKNGRAIGHPLTEYLPQAEETGVATIFRTVAETGLPYQAGEYSFPAFEYGTTYWNWTLDPVRDSAGRIVQLLETLTEVTTQVLARQEAERTRTSLSQTNRAVEADRKRLEVIETVARSVRESLDTESVSMAAIKALSAKFNSLYVYTYIANPIQKTLDLLHIYPALVDEQAFRDAQRVPYDSPLLIAQACKQHNPIIIEDTQIAASLGAIDSSNPILMSGARGYVCVPLWFGDTLEGTLTAIFKESISIDGPEVPALMGSGIHIAAALAHARLHTALENERIRLHTILDQLPEGILITEASDGLINYANAAAARILNLPVTSLTGFPLNLHPHINVVARTNNSSGFPWHFAVIRALSGETISSQEAIVIRPDASNAVILSSSAPLYAEGGNITGAIIVFQDITTQKSIEQQKSEFLSIASHELRTPITAIQGFAEILQITATREQRLGPKSLRALTFINEQSEFLARLIEEMLDLTRIENAQLALNLAPHDLITTINHVIETQSTNAGHHDLQFILEGLQSTDKLITIFDENRIIQVLNNLIANAIKYSPAGSRIEVGLRYASTSAHEVLIWVKDTGIGIAANELAYIFNRFHRSSSIDRSISGLGIGLYLVQELVTRHGGHVWAESTRGSGSTFYVLLPVPRTKSSLKANSA